MLSSILFIIIGVWLKAPVWYFVLCAAMLIANLFVFGIKMYKAGSDKE